VCVSVGFVMCGCVCVFGFFNVWVCVCVGIVMCVCVFGNFVMCGICNMGVCVCMGGFSIVWVCVCVGFVMCGFVYVWFL